MIEFKQPEVDNKPQVELMNQIEIEENYILTSHLGDWQKLYNEYMFHEGQQNWDLRGELPAVYKQIFEAIKRGSLSNG